jgi:membrane protease YdiL (CAAX protease family)
MKVILKEPVTLRPVLIFYLLAFTISWIGWIPTLAASREVAVFRHPWWNIMLLLPGAGPALAAAIAAKLEANRESLPRRLTAMFCRSVGPRWYLIAIFAPAAILFAANSISAMLWGASYQTVSPWPLPPASFFIFRSILSNPCEEIGWRGFALPRLEKGLGAFAATLIVGVLWGAWHLPLFLWPGNPMGSYPVLPWFAALMGETFILTWLFNSTSKSVLIASLFHIAFNGWSVIMGICSFSELALVEAAVAILIIGLGKLRGGVRTIPPF